SHRPRRVRPAARSRTSAGRSRCDPFPGSCTSLSSQRQSLRWNLEPVYRAEDGRGKRAILQQVARDPLHILQRDALDALERLVEPEVPVKVDLLASQMRHAARGALEIQHQAALQVILGAPQLRFR